MLRMGLSTNAAGIVSRRGQSQFVVQKVCTGTVLLASGSIMLQFHRGVLRCFGTVHTGPNL